jgi:transposase
MTCRAVACSRRHAVEWTTLFRLQIELPDSPGARVYDGQGLCLFSKRLERGHFVWPATDTGRVSLTPAQLSMLLEGIDWRMPQRVRRPKLAG